MKSVEDRFWAKVNKTDDCWLWTGATTTHGYGVLNIWGRLNGAHRVSWMIHHRGMSIDGLDICHRCDNPPCVNPDHLFAGSTRDNMLDAISKGRRTYTKLAHCQRGHPFDEANTYHYRGDRMCRKCRGDASRRHKRRNLAVLAA